MSGSDAKDPWILRTTAVLVLAAVAAAGAASGFPTGTVVDKVVTAVDPEHSYALYLPSNYQPDRYWPVLYLFDARRRGAAMARHHQEAAERLGWIVVSSNNSESDGDFEPNRRAMIALWDDSHARFPIDPRRRYAAGFSGGARVAVILAQVRNGEVAGVIGWGAGFPVHYKPVTSRPPFVYFGAIGDADYNYSELTDLDAALEAVGARRRVRVFEGGHEWPPTEVAAEAMTWMEIEAMRRGLSTVDLELVGDAYASRSARAGTLEAAGRLQEAVAESEAMVADFAGFHEVEEAEERVARLRATPAWSDTERAVAEATDWESNTFERIKQAFNATAADAPVQLDLQEVLAVVDLDGLRRRAQEADRRELALAARRVLARLAGQTTFMLPKLMNNAGDSRRALLMLEIGVRVAPDSAPVWLELGRTAIRAGDPQRSLEALEKALELGLERGAIDAAEPLWNPVRGTPRFDRLTADG